MLVEDNVEYKGPLLTKGISPWLSNIGFINTIGYMLPMVTLVLLLTYHYGQRFDIMVDFLSFYQKKLKKLKNKQTGVLHINTLFWIFTIRISN